MNGLLGVGNPRLGDDALGPVFARAFRAPGWRCWNGGIAPENYAPVLRRAGLARLVILDAAEMGLPPGTLRELPPGRLAAAGFGTHAPSLSSLASYLSDAIPVVTILGIQPLSCIPSTPLSPPVRKALKDLASTLLSLD